MSPREFVAWINLVAIAVIFIPYFALVFRILEGGGAVALPLLRATIVAMGCQFVVTVAALVLMALREGASRGDERDLAIEARSLRSAYFTLVALLIGVLPTLSFWGAMLVPAPRGTLWVPSFAMTVEFVFLCFVVAETLRYAAQVFCYRRDASR